MPAEHKLTSRKEHLSKTKVGVKLLIRWSRVRISSGPLIKLQKMKKPKFKVDKHTLTPKHLKVSEKEKTQVLEKYLTTSKELPKIFRTDAAIKEFDAKPGDLIKIIRKSQTAGEAVFYRVVTDV